MERTTGVEDIAEKIRSMEIRGAGRIARAAAKALQEHALSAKASSVQDFEKEMRKAADLLLQTRPTAVSLSNSVRIVMRHDTADLESARSQIVSNAESFISNSLQAVERIGEIGARSIRKGDKILTHCNSHAAISVISHASMAGLDISVIATESRPMYQGHLTIRMLDDIGVDTELIVDSAARFVMNEVDLVVVGADVITAGGSLVNKIGTSQIALCANEARTPFMVAAETYKFSPATLMGEMVPIEERSHSEVLPQPMGRVRVRNPAFDVTPKRYIDVIVTEVGAIPPEMSYLIIKEKLGWELP